MSLFFHIRAMPTIAPRPIAILHLISGVHSPSLSIVEPRKVKLSTSISSPFTTILIFVLSAVVIILVLLTNAEHNNNNNNNNNINNINNNNNNLVSIN